MRRTTRVLFAVLGLFVVLNAQPLNVNDIGIDRTLDGVRVTIACSGSPNVSSFTTESPPALAIDIMDATSRVPTDRIVSQYYPVTMVSVQPSEATNGVRVVIQLRDMVQHRVTVENGVISVQLGTEPLVEPVSRPSTDQFAGKRLTLYVRDADVSDVVRMIAQQFNLNILATQDVRAAITVHLTDVPLRVGLEAVLKAALCNMVEDDHGVIIVKPIRKQMYGSARTRVFELDYIEAEDAMKAVAKVLSEDGKVEEGFRRVGGATGQAKNRNSVLVVTDIPEALVQVERLLAELDRPVPQISIEAKFVETTHSAEDRFGIDWRTVFSFNTEGMNIGEDAALPVILPFGGVRELYFGKVSLAQFSASLELLMSRGNSRLLSNPRTMTLDNQTATVSMGLDIPVREVHKDAQTGALTYTWRTRSVPISLEVTPHVTANGEVTMRVKPSVEAITGWVGSADDQQPIVAKREAETQVSVRDGEVVVIGGLVKDEETRNVGKVPLLGDIPIIGHLFRKTSIQRNKSDLMIFIIPHVIMPTES
ncbi:MAG: AMIN domain-containing protein [candidate division WOR-3 bacterium]